MSRKEQCKDASFLKGRKSSVEKIAKAIEASDNFYIFPHIHADGDAIGSSTALCLALRKLGKNAVVILEEKPADNLAFMTEGVAIVHGQEQLPFKGQVSIAVDCGDQPRIGTRLELFLCSKATMCIDHHTTCTYFCQDNLVDSKASATGLLIYKILRKLYGKSLLSEDHRDVANRLFAAILTDTGGFKYSNTTKESHKITADLYDMGLDENFVSVEIYESNPLSKFKMEAKVFETAELLADDQVVLAYVTEEILRNTGSKMEETEGMVPRLRSIKGVEVAAFLKEYGPREVKVSLRSKERVDVAAISQSFGGGGHKRAAGFTLRMPIREAVLEMKALLTEDKLRKYGF